LENEDVEKLVEKKVKEQLEKMDNEGAKFALVNGITIEQYLTSLFNKGGEIGISSRGWK